MSLLCAVMNQIQSCFSVCNIEKLGVTWEQGYIPSTMTTTMVVIAKLLLMHSWSFLLVEDKNYTNVAGIVQSPMTRDPL